MFKMFKINLNLFTRRYNKRAKKIGSFCLNYARIILGLHKYIYIYSM